MQKRIALAGREEPAVGSNMRILNRSGPVYLWLETARFAG